MNFTFANFSVCVLRLYKMLRKPSHKFKTTLRLNLLVIIDINVWVDSLHKYKTLNILCVQKGEGYF